MLPEFLIIPDFNRLSESVRLSREHCLGFEYNDFYFPAVYSDRDEVKRRIDAYRSLGRDMSRDTLHGAFLDIAFASSDKTIRDYSRSLVEQSAQIASELGVRAVIYHTGIISRLNCGAYQKAWLDAAEELFSSIAEKNPTLTLCIENTFEESPEVFSLFAKRVENIENIAICLDYAHASLTSTPCEEWVEALAPYIKHIHLNDNNLKQDQHKIPGSGLIDFKKFRRLLDKQSIDSPILLELNGIENQQKAYEFMKKLYSEEVTE